MSKRIGSFRKELSTPVTTKEPVRYALLSDETDVVLNIIKAYRASCVEDRIKPLPVNKAFQIVVDQLVRNMFKPKSVITITSPGGETWDVDLNDYADVADFNRHADDVVDPDGQSGSTPGNKGQQIDEDEELETEDKESDAQGGQRELTEEEELAEIERQLEEESNKN